MMKGQIENVLLTRAVPGFNLYQLVCQLNMTELFRQCANFGQKRSMRQTSPWKLTADFDLVGVWSANGLRPG